MFAIIDEVRNMMKYRYISKSESETKTLAGNIVEHLRPGDVVLLTGDLGAGKTTFVSGALKKLGYSEHVVSPTFNILKCYFEVKPPVFHIDAYRLENQNHDIGLEEFIEGNGITFVEWPIYIPELIPPKHLSIELTRIDDDKRNIIISDETDSYKELFASLKVN